MAKPIKILILFFVGLVAFFFFLYKTFPYSILKDRLVSSIESAMEGKYEIQIGELRPSFFTGLILENITILVRDNEGKTPFMALSKIRGRVGFFSLIFGSPNVSFYIKTPKSYVDGSFSTHGSGYELALGIDKFDFSDMKYLKESIGLDVGTTISGDIKLNIQAGRIVATTGSMNLELSLIQIHPSQLHFGQGMEFDIPELFISKSADSKIKVIIDKGIGTVELFRFRGGDFDLSANGQIYLSTRAENFRLNLRGDFKPSKQFEDAVPVLFMVQKQKQEDGSYPFTLSGRMGKPQIKIGDFNLPTGL